MVWNGQLVDESEVDISVLSPTIMYGHGVFETMRTYGGKIFELSRHIDRLKNSAKLVKLDVEVPGVDYFEGCFEMLGMNDGEYRCKIMVCKEGILCMVVPFEPDLKQIENGIKCISMNMDRCLPNAKKISYVDSHVGALKAKESGVGETLLVGNDGVVTEGAYSNLFWVVDGQIYTNPIERVLPGVTRSVVMELFEVVEKEISLHELLMSDEVFITKTTLGVVPVVGVDDVDFGVGTITQQIQEEFNQYIKCGM